MINELMDVEAALKAQAADIVAGGTDIRPRLAGVVAQHAANSQDAGGLLKVLQAVTDGAREGFSRTVPQDSQDALRQVVDALDDGVSQSVLAARLALAEAAGSSQRFRDEDLTRLRNDLTAVRDLFVETVDRGLSAGKALTAEQVDSARRHAERAAARLRPSVAQALDAIKQHPAEFVRTGLQAGAAAGQAAAGALFQAIGRAMARAGDHLRRDDRDE